MNWRWILLAAAIAAPAMADTQFRARIEPSAAMTGSEECNIRLSTKGAVEVRVHLDSVIVQGAEARNDGSQCTAPLPAQDLRGFHLQGQGAELISPPTSHNDYQAVVRLPGSGRVRFQLSWQTGPEGFSWNNAVRFKSRGHGEVTVGAKQLALTNVDIAMDLGGKFVAAFRTEDKRTLSFSGVVNQRDTAKWRADVVCDGPEWHVQGPMFLTVDPGKDQVTSVTLEATDGRDHMTLHWSAGKR